MYINDILRIAKANNISANRLLQDADCLDSYGFHLYYDFRGYRSWQIREAAEHANRLKAA